MKYLKRINEDLETSTYLSAAQKLDNLKHTNRAKKLRDWSMLSAGEKQKKLYFKFGEVDIEFDNVPVTGSKGKYEKAIGKYYIYFYLDPYSFEHEDIEKNKEGYFHLPIGLIPKDRESYDIVEKLEMSVYNSIYWAFYVSVKFYADHGSIKYANCGLYIENGYSCRIANRKSAVTLKRILVNGVGNPEYNYPFNYYDNEELSNLSDQIDLKFGSELSMSIDYGFSARDLANYINYTMPVNTLYRD